MSGFVCPICSFMLKREDKSLKCKNNHSFDISKSGYTNLLLSQKSGNHGDDKLMVRARRDFLNSGYYDFLRDKLSETVKKYSKNGYTILDAGCGECFYTADIHKVLNEAGISVGILAVDISKNALTAAKNRAEGIQRAVASIFNIPVSDNSCDIVLNVFAPFCREEFFRILKPRGIYIQVIPLKNHLIELKNAVYDKPYVNAVNEYRIDGFELIKSAELHNRIELKSNEDIKNLFMMTPYYYKTSEKDFKKLDFIETLKVRTEFAILCYRKTEQ